MAARLLRVGDVPRPSASETELLAEAVASGIAAMRALRPQDHARMAAGSRFLYRRWVLEILLVLRARGPASFNELSRTLGRLAGESLAPKLQDLAREGLVAREAGDGPRRVRYRLTRAGEPLAAGVYALTTVKREHTRALVEQRRPEALLGALAHPGPAGEPLARFERAVGDFARANLDRAGPALDAQLGVARRFSEACVRKWHGDVLAALEGGGPMRFSELRAALGAGDQALAAALAALEGLASVERRADGAWAIAPMGLLDMAIGAPLILLLPSVRDAALQPA